MDLIVTELNRKIKEYNNNIKNFKVDKIETSCTCAYFTMTSAKNSNDFAKYIQKQRIEGEFGKKLVNNTTAYQISQAVQDAASNGKMDVTFPIKKSEIDFDVICDMLRFYGYTIDFMVNPNDNTDTFLVIEW